MKPLLTIPLLLLCLNVFGQIKVKEDLCDINVALRHIKVLQMSAKQMLDNTDDDNCVLTFLDTLTTLYTNTGKEPYIQMLHAISKVSDGYVSEYMLEVTNKLALNAFLPFVTFLSSKDDTKAMEDFLVHGMQMKKINGANPKKQQFYQLIELHKQEGMLTPETTAYLNQISSRIEN